MDWRRAISQAAFIVEGVWREVFVDKFFDDAKESFGHAKLVGNKIASLGGVPVATRNEVKQSRDLEEVLKFSLAFESKAVEMYQQAIAMAEEINNRPLVIFLEDILKDEQEGVEEYTKLLRSTPSQTAQIATARNWALNWTAPLGKRGSHRRQTVDAIVNDFHRLAADGYENFALSNSLTSAHDRQHRLAARGGSWLRVRLGSQVP